jgi:hypothetical protein
MTNNPLFETPYGEGPESQAMRETAPSGELTEHGRDQLDSRLRGMLNPEFVDHLTSETGYRLGHRLQKLAGAVARDQRVRAKFLDLKAEISNEVLDAKTASDIDTVYSGVLECRRLLRAQARDDYELSYWAKIRNGEINDHDPEAMRDLGYLLLSSHGLLPA